MKANEVRSMLPLLYCGGCGMPLTEGQKKQHQEHFGSNYRWESICTGCGHTLVYTGIELSKELH